MALTERQAMKATLSKSQMHLQMPAAPGQRIGYIRVSTAEQNIERQVEAIGVCHRVFKDEESGSKVTRQGLEDMLNHIREGDEVIVAEVDRLARSEVDLANIVKEITDKGCSVVFLQDNLKFSGNNEDPTAYLMLHMLGAIGAFSRRLMLKRQKEGIAAAQARGVKFGRPLKSDPEDILQFYLENPSFGPTALGKKFGVSRSTAHRAIKEHAEYRRRRALSPIERDAKQASEN
ncbi:MAG: recombinase family protein [Proteobacteria bacterium]|nr:recombinase family protein [Pseudomonadota bacterium]